MPRKKSQPKTLEEKLHEEKMREWDFITREIPFINEPTYYFNVGDEVSLGCLKNCIIYEIMENGKVYGVKCIRTDNNYGNPIDIPTYRVVAWHRVRPLQKKEQEIIFSNPGDPFRLNFYNTSVESLIHSYYQGVNMNPNYQRDYVWTMEDKIALIDSIFQNIDIGKFVFNNVDTQTWLETGFSDEIIDGKQRLSTIIEFYENRFPYKNLYYNDLHPYDKYCFKHLQVSVAKVENATKEDILRYFIKLNTCGKTMSKKDLDKVVSMLNLEEINNG